MAVTVFHQPKGPPLGPTFSEAESQRRLTTGGLTTSTQESSEAPREATGDLGLVERYEDKALQDRRRAKYAPDVGELADAAAYAEVQAANDAARAKVSSPELATLASDFMSRASLTQADLPNVKRLAASVLAQAQKAPK